MKLTLKNILTFVFSVLFVYGLALNAAVARPARGVKLPSELLYVQDKLTCGYVEGRWNAGVNRKGVFKKYGLLIKTNRKKYKNTGFTNYLLKSRRLKKKRKKQQPLCNALAQPSIVANLTQLPDLSTLTGSVAQSQFYPPLGAVSGTPPLLSGITAPKDTFWRLGVVDAINAGNPNPTQCNEFWTGQNDGESGGMGSCVMAQGVGFSFENILRAGTSLCYMKNMPTQANVDAGAISLKKGKLPSGRIENIFTPPSGSSDRIVQVKVSDPVNGTRDIFIEVTGQNTLTQQGKQYHAELWFCDSQNSTPFGTEFLNITMDGAFSESNQDIFSDGGGGEQAFKGSVSGYVTTDSNGAFIFDPEKSRKALAVFSDQTGGFSSKTEVEIASDGKIKTKDYSVFQGQQGGGKIYSVASYTGNDMSNLRFPAGAFKDEFFHYGATEYRDTYYASAPTSHFLQDLNDVDIGTDSFYQAPPAVNIDTSKYSCSAQADIIVTMDFQNPAALAIQAACEFDEFSNMDFCLSDPDINNAQNNWSRYCSRP